MPGFSITDILSTADAPHHQNDSYQTTADCLADLSHLVHEIHSDSDEIFSETSSPPPATPSVTSESPVASPSASLAPSPESGTLSAATEALLSGARLYSHLQTTLAQERSATPWTLFASSPPVAPLQNTPLTNRECLLQMTFHDPHLNALYPHHLSELRNAHEREKGRLASERQVSLESVRHMPWLEQSIISYYLLQETSLIERIERSLSLLRSMRPVAPLVSAIHTTPINTPRRTVASSTGKGYSKKTLNERAVRIMDKWYSGHEEHPYPSYESCEVMAEAGEISVEQVKKWFANRRLRRRNTKSLSEIARRRQVVRSTVDSVNAAWWMASQM